MWGPRRYSHEPRRCCGCHRWGTTKRRAPAERFNHAALAIVLYEGIVLLGSALGQRLEPVGIMSDAHLHGPLLHAGSYCIGDGTVQTGTIVNHINHLVVNLSGQVFIHLLLGEDVFAKKL